MRAARHRGNRGFALVCVLWVLAILMVLVFGFARRTLIDRRAAAASLDHVQARFMARGAVECAIAEIQNRAAVEQLLASVQEQMANRPVHERPSMQLQQARPPAFLWKTSPNLLGEGQLFESSGGDEFADDVCEYRIEDAESRICLNTAKEELLEEVPGLSHAVINEIMRRRGSEDPEERTVGFLCAEELRYIEGVTDNDWYGDSETPGLRDLFTVWGAESGKRKGCINVNTALPEVLRCIPDIDEALVEAIILYREGSDGELFTNDDMAFKDEEDFGSTMTAQGHSAEDIALAVQYCTFSSQYFTIRARATQRRGRVQAECTAVVHAPPPMQGGAGGPPGDRQGQPMPQSAKVVEWREDVRGS